MNLAQLHLQTASRSGLFLALLLIATYTFNVNGFHPLPSCCTRGIVIRVHASVLFPRGATVKKLSVPCYNQNGLSIGTNSFDTNILTHGTVTSRLRMAKKVSDDSDSSSFWKDKKGAFQSIRNFARIRRGDQSEAMDEEEEMNKTKEGNWISRKFQREKQQDVGEKQSKQPKGKNDNQEQNKRKRKEKEEKERQKREKEAEVKAKAKLKLLDPKKSAKRGIGEKSEDKKKKTDDSKGGYISAAQSYISGALFRNDNVTKEEWAVVCPKIAIAPGVSVPVAVNGINLLIIASRDAKRLYCIENSCPHLGTPLETGIMKREEKLKTVTKDTPGSVMEDDMTKSQSRSFPFFGNQKTVPKGQGQVNDGCEDCITCPLHQTQFSLESGEPRGEWCPYPPVIGSIVGAIKPKANLVKFAVRARGKNIEVRINSALD
mmetsp:Transcript_33219/g.48776  ORF Transcript_33219/g.48776 Transcript_33219/m.48776 type:complete len:431 (-) Transcript_33219:94-1386(-)|eukprot:CAMPEP_0195527140 /NCGR_PEP_ID=MMETSP0794_2-20130614/28631_1 /TAXON_ID=515487 /ORGANISM="Stephanopyxis turris, Strain CCMP 815" /LENGTH=430 /DNA_ID=CAMNT_0040657989 /DNA_START=113 /DNA_END=1405 /DNA_ORIENTATION=-